MWSALNKHLRRVIPEDATEETLSKLEASVRPLRAHVSAGTYGAGAQADSKHFLAALLGVISSFMKDKARPAPESLAEIVGVLHGTRRAGPRGGSLIGTVQTRCFTWRS